MEEEKISIENDTAEEQIIDVQPPEEQKEKKGKKRGKYKKNDTAEEQPPEEKKGKKRGKNKKNENDTAEELDFNAFKAFFLGS